MQKQTLTSYPHPKIPKKVIPKFLAHRTAKFDPKNVKPSYDPEEHYKWHEKQSSKHEQLAEIAKSKREEQAHKEAVIYHNHAYTWHSVNFDYMIADNFEGSVSKQGQKQYKERLEEAKYGEKCLKQYK